MWCLKSNDDEFQNHGRSSGRFLSQWQNKAKQKVIYKFECMALAGEGA
jgi:hypothetical protein